MTLWATRPEPLRLQTDDWRDDWPAGWQDTCKARTDLGAAPVVSWLDLVELCRELDEALDAAESQSADSLALRKAVVGLTIGCGTWLLHEVRVNGADISASGHAIETLGVSLELLRIRQRSRHPDFSPAEIEAAQRRILMAAA